MTCAPGCLQKSRSYFERSQLSPSVTSPHKLCGLKRISDVKMCVICSKKKKQRHVHFLSSAYYLYLHPQHILYESYGYAACLLWKLIGMKYNGIIRVLGDIRNPSSELQAREYWCAYVAISFGAITCPLCISNNRKQDDDRSDPRNIHEIVHFCSG